MDQLTFFYKKLKNAANASGDTEAENLIVRVIQQKIDGIAETDKRMSAEKATLQERATRLSLGFPENR